MSIATLAPVPVQARLLNEQTILSEVDTLLVEVLPDPIISVGLDLSLTASGLADSSGQVDVLGREGLTNLPVYDLVLGLDALADQILTRVHKLKPEIVVLEALDMAQSYGGQVERTVLWWKVMEGLQHRYYRTATPTSAQVKIYATGNGLATKQQMVAAVKEHWPQFPVGRNNNKADAAAMAALGTALVGKPLRHLDERHTRVLGRIRYTTDPPSRVLKREAK